MDYKVIDLTDRKFGNWTVLNLYGMDDSSKNSMWLCKCICGTEKPVNRCSLVKGDSKSCGCMRNPCLEEKIARKIDFDENGCWNWTGKLKKDGYATIYFKDRYMPVHRASLILFSELDPFDKIVCHLCDNRKCVNPDHLYFGTHRDNMLDRGKRNRKSFQVGSEHGNSIFIDKDIFEIRKMYELGNSIKNISKIKKCGYNTILKIVRRKTWKHI